MPGLRWEPDLYRNAVPYECAELRRSGIVVVHSLDAVPMELKNLDDSNYEDLAPTEST